MKQLPLAIGAIVGRGLLPAVRALLDFLGERFADNDGHF